MASSAARALRRYYEWNTGLFLRLGGGQSTLSLHRSVWGEGVDSREEAFAYPYRLVHRTIEQVAASRGVDPAPPEDGRAEPPQDRPLRVLDFGCGVGGGILYLLDRFDDPLRAMGVTLSPTQVDIAHREARRRGFDAAQYAFMEADFHDLPALEPIDVAFAIEAFALSERPESFFEEAARVLRPGGRLVVIDDFLADPASEQQLSPTQKRWVETVQKGWHAYGLCSVSTAVTNARAQNLQLVKNKDLTSHLALGRPRDHFIKWCIVPLRPFLWRWPYFRGLIGGDAVQKCLKERIIEYRHLVFKRTR